MNEEKIREYMKSMGLESPASEYAKCTAAIAAQLYRIADAFEAYNAMIEEQNKEAEEDPTP